MTVPSSRVKHLYFAKKRLKKEMFLMRAVPLAPLQNPYKTPLMCLQFNL